MEEHNFQDFQKKLYTAFTPSSPIKDQKFLAGRKLQINALIESIKEDGMHAIICGERGTGKTSLANSLLNLLPQNMVFRTAANNASDYDALWRMLLRRVPFSQEKKSFGFLPQSHREFFVLEHALPQNRKIVVDDLIDIFEKFGFHGIAIFDDFDCIVDQGTKMMMVETLKSISDLGLPITIRCLSDPKDGIPLIGL